MSRPARLSTDRPLFRVDVPIFDVMRLWRQGVDTAEIARRLSVGRQIDLRESDVANALARRLDQTSEGASYAAG